MSSTAIAIVALVAVALIAGLLFRSSAKRKRALADATHDLGLESIASLDPALADRILELYKPPQANPAATIKWSLANVVRCPDPNGDCYSIVIRCDITEWRQKGGGQAITSRSKEERVVALLVRGGLNAPRIDMLPIALNPSPGASGL